jgi:hypothetical protein
LTTRLSLCRKRIMNGLEPSALYALYGTAVCGRHGPDGHGCKAFHFAQFSRGFRLARFTVIIDDRDGKGWLGSASA